jgi:ATP-binding cassette subfamily B (MDR/TAP) protein 1
MAMVDEMNSISHNYTWQLTKLLVGKRPIIAKWTFKVKNDSTSKPSKYKVKLVARGFEQKEGLDFQETFAPIIKWSTIRSVTVLITHFGWKISHMDVKTMFLNNDKKEEVYMKQPKGFIKFGYEQLICKLNKVFYRLLQAS